MNNLMKYFIIPWLVIILSSCTSRYLTTAWKANDIYPGKFKKVLVISVLPERDSAYRNSLESRVVEQLQANGYHAISALSTFGQQGLANSSEENTFIKLCESEIDAVMTLALLPATKENLDRDGEHANHPGSYYYTRIWNYKKIIQETTGTDTISTLFWESILFDLANLEATCSLQSHVFEKDDKEKSIATIPQKMIDRFLKENVLKKKPRAF